MTLDKSHDGGELVPYSEEFLERVRQLKQAMYDKQREISRMPTPKEHVDKRPDGYDYVKEHFMRDKLNELFPGWSWEMGGPPLFLGSEWVFVWGHLTVIEESLLAFGIVPPIRKFGATNGVSIKFKSGQSHTVKNVIDIGNDVAAANAKAFKIAINRLCNITDDVYKKRVDVEAEEEGVGDELIDSLYRAGKRLGIDKEEIDTRLRGLDRRAGQKLLSEWMRKARE